MLFRKLIFLLLAALCSQMAAPEGFAPSTLVRTRWCGLMPIAQLVVGMEVYCYSPEGKIEFKPITAIRKDPGEYRYLVLSVEDQKIFADASQYFYCPKQGKWVKLVDLDTRTDTVLANYSIPVPIKDRELITTTFRWTPTPMYSISVKDHQNFFITEQEILVHNFTVVEEDIALVGVFLGYVLVVGIEVATEFISKKIIDQIKIAAGPLFKKNDDNDQKKKPDVGKPGDKNQPNNTPPPNDGPGVPDISKVKEDLDKRAENYLNKVRAGKKPSGDIPTQQQIIDYLSGSSRPGKSSKNTTQYVRLGDDKSPLIEMQYFNPSNVRVYSKPNGPTTAGDLLNGKTINARPHSSGEAPTLEILDEATGHSIKYRFVDSFDSAMAKKFLK